MDSSIKTLQKHTDLNAYSHHQNSLLLQHCRTTWMGHYGITNVLIVKLPGGISKLWNMRYMFKDLQHLNDQTDWLVD